jgi:hypothetical protein
MDSLPPPLAFFFLLFSGWASQDLRFEFRLAFGGWTESPQGGP